MSTLNIGIIGAGVSGLGSAANILKTFPNAKIRIIADKFKSDTTSWGSGGFWEPYVMAQTPQHKIHRWGKSTFEYFMETYQHNNDSKQHGIQIQRVNQFWTDDTEHEQPFWTDIVQNFRRFEQDELVDKQSRAKSGWTFDSIVADQSYYIPYLMEQLEDQGCKFEQNRVENIDDLQDENFNIVINCAGIGSRELLPDEGVYPVRGQVVRVKGSPQVSGVWFMDETSYIITNVDTVVLGGTQQLNDWNQENDQQDVQNILRDVCELVPCLEGAEIVNPWAGLRPGRKQVRLEIEKKRLQNGSIMRIVHNYGHGGSGVTLHWGCGQEVTELVEQLLQ